MKGRLVGLQWPSDGDWALIAEWLRPASPAAAMSSDWESVSAADVEQINRSGKVRNLVIRCLGDNEAVGVVSYQQAGRPDSYSLGGIVGEPDLWNRGYGAEAMVLLVDMLFHQMAAHRVTARTAMYNKNVTRLMMRTQFVVEGVLRDHFFLDGSYHDAVLWAMLRDEFYESLRPSEHNRVIGTGPATFVSEDDKRVTGRLFADYLAGAHRTSIDRFLEQHGHADGPPEERVHLLPVEDGAL